MIIDYRNLEVKDVKQLVSLGRTFHEVSGLSNYGAVFNDSHVRDMLVNMIANQDSLVLVAVNVSWGRRWGLVYGAIGAHLSHHIMNRDNGLVMELFQWIRPEARGLHIGSGLLRCLEDWAKSKGAVTVAMMSMHSIAGHAADQFTKHGYAPTETVWMKRLG